MPRLVYVDSRAINDVKPAFKVVGELSEALAPTGNQVVELAAGFTRIGSTNIRAFDWPNFKHFIDNYKGDDLTFDQYSDFRTGQGDLRVFDIVTGITNFYSSSGISLDEAELVIIVTKVFIELKKAKRNGWADFKSAEKSGWQYRIAFMLPFGSSTGLFKTILTTIKFDAEVVDDADWYNLTEDSILKGFTGVVELMGLVVIKGFENPQFDEVYIGLASELIPTAQQVTRLLNKHVKSGYSERFFDWAGFKKAIDEYQGDDLVFDKFNQGNTSSSKQTLKALVDLLSVYLRDSFGGSVDIDKVKDTVLSTFNGLQQNGGRGYLDFHQIADNKSSWEYRAIFFTPMANRQTYFYGTVVTITVTADVGPESSWWGLQDSSSKVFSASTSALNLVVGKNFQNEPSM
ncbi:hypothetical protein AX16_005143 [Volvariella volvacea WC 439]|nr:hypothetical protein AX16_005143 [Volvariella volvacea WC 439]